MLNFLKKLAASPKEADSDTKKHSEPSTARTGAEGEDAAAALLSRLGWKILHRNWRAGHLELDIVAEEQDVLVFVEVKTRAGNGLQRPFEALTAVKKERLCRAAQAWLDTYKAWDRPCRFDLVSVTSQAGTYQTELIRNVIEYG